MRKIGMFSIWGNTETIMSWFKDRASGQRGETEADRRGIGKIFFPTIKSDLRKLGFTFGKMRWSSKAGCSCGCSPGYLIFAENRSKKVQAIIDSMQGPKNILHYFYEKGKLTRYFAGPNQMKNRYDGYKQEQLAEALGVELGTHAIIATFKK